MSTLFPDAPRTRFLELTNEEWAILVLGATVTVAGLAASRDDVGFWPALGIGFTMLVVGHLCLTARRYVAFPDLIASAACLQWIIAPWLSETYQPTLATFRMQLPADEYLRYALPATVALWVGLQLPASRRLSKTWEMPDIGFLSSRVQRLLDLLIVAGLVADFYVDFAPIQWAFLAYLISSFRFVGALGWMVTRTPGWQWRVGFVLVHLTAVQSTGGLFYLVVHWGGYFLLVYAFMKRWRWQMAVALAVGLIGLSLLQSVKPTLRVSIAEQEVKSPIDSFQRLTTLLWERVRTGQIVDPETNPGDALVRFNQGWIISRIMKHVPDEQPYAMGQTISDAVVFSIVPRFLVPSKLQGSSQKIFTLYTGSELIGGTRMGLGIIGEFYANFGQWGGVVGTFVYGLAIGGIFLFFADKAQRNPLWWAVASTVLLPSVEPGFNLEDILNHVVKAAIVLLIVWKLFPPMQRLLAPVQADDESAESSDDHDDSDNDEVSPSFDDAIANP
ncbi:MAG TPA: hypothetical protein VGH34_04980 [Vicinamibacterales bacterium]